MALDGPQHASKRRPDGHKTARCCHGASQGGSREAKILKKTVCFLMFFVVSSFSFRCPSTASRWPQCGSCWAHLGPTWPQDGAKTAPRWPHRAPRWAQEGAKKAPNGAVLIYCSPFFCHFTSKTPQNGPKSASGGLQEGPKSPQESTRRPPRGPQRAQRRPQLGPKRVTRYYTRSYNTTHDTPRRPSNRLFPNSNLHHFEVLLALDFTQLD